MTSSTPLVLRPGPVLIHNFAGPGFSAIDVTADAAKHAFSACSIDRGVTVADIFALARQNPIFVTIMSDIGAQQILDAVEQPLSEAFQSSSPKVEVVRIINTLWVTSSDRHLALHEMHTPTVVGLGPINPEATTNPLEELIDGRPPVSLEMIDPRLVLQAEVQYDPHVEFVTCHLDELNFASYKLPARSLIEYLRAIFYALTPTGVEATFPPDTFHT